MIAMTRLLSLQEDDYEIQIFATSGFQRFPIILRIFIVIGQPVLPNFLIAYHFLNRKNIYSFLGFNAFFEGTLHKMENYTLKVYCGWEYY